MIRLHIGCFDVPLAGWYNTDVTIHIVVARIPFLAPLLHALGLIDARRYQQHRDGVFHKVHYLNALKKFPFSDYSVEAVYSSCMLTNFTRQQALVCLKEINRILRPDSILRIAVPDLDRWLRTYDPNDPDGFLRLIFEPEIKAEENRIHWMYNPFSLKKILQEAGFKNVVICEMCQGKCPDAQKIDYRSDVVYMEGEK
jgi:SAM-dependent methyltransferase